jgi:hypothetical protein
VLHKALMSGDPGVWAAAREGRERVDLSGVDVSTRTLADFDLSGADLSTADLSETDLTGASLDGAKLDGADLTAAKLLEVEVHKASFAGAALDEVRLAGMFVECDFSDTTWENAVVRGARFVKCDFDSAELDLDALVRGNRFEKCTWGDRTELPDALSAGRPEFLHPPVLEGERVIVGKLALAYRDEAELRNEAIGAATGAGWEAEMVAFLKHGEAIYVGLRTEAGVDELEEWLRFERDADGRLAANQLVLDPGFETFLEEVVLPMVESARGDLAITIEQDLEDGRTAVTELAAEGGRVAPPKQFKRAPG